MTKEQEIRVTETQSHAGFFGWPSLIVLLLCVIASHLSLLRVPYFWDETYFAPAARDLFLTGKLVPVSVPVESHPPLVYLWVAIWWKLFGFSILVARSAMLAVSAITLAAVYRLARLFTSGAVSIVIASLTAIYPVFFVESTLVQLDMAAAGLTLWGLVACLQGRRWETSAFFTLAVLAKETAIIAPCAVLAVDLILALLDRKQSIGASIRSELRKAIPLLLPFLALVAWFAWLHHVSGTIFGDPFYVRYNLEGAARPTRIFLAAVQHLWHLLGFLNLFILTAVTAIIFVARSRFLAPDAPRQNTRSWVIFAMLTVGYVVMLSIVGGVTLARYLLPVYPLIFLACVAAIASRVKWWPAIAGLTAAAFVVGLFPYTDRYLFRRDDNLAYLDYVALHQAAIASFDNGQKWRVASAWPASDELSMPWLGYSKTPLDAAEIDSFTRDDLLAAGQKRPQYILMFPRGACKAENPFQRAHGPQGNYFRGTQDLSPDEVAGLMNARVIYRAQSRCDWVAVLKVDDVDTAQPGQAAH
ncbi:MAG TPA: glycosyltransferase family 39 protein [Candidatus Acidoferrum sp.]|nr:glycosyltransferase family 39 protein [Candidatus Acidoferrum sp.]